MRKNLRDPLPQHFTHNASLCRVHPLQWTDQELESPQASCGGWHLSQDGHQGSSPPSTSTGCFTLSSPATLAEGLCQYKSGYLHWVRKPISFNHIIHLRRSYPCDTSLRVSCHIFKSCFKLQDGSPSVQHMGHYAFILIVLETLLRCWLLKCWQVVFFFSAASEAYRDLSDSNSKL